MGEPRLAAYLRFNAEIGGILTLRKLREALGEPNRPNDHEHFNRRFRQLRKYGWTVLSSRDFARPETGPVPARPRRKPNWLGKSQFTKKSVSAKVRRQVFDRDGPSVPNLRYRCRRILPDDPTKHARLTLGHFVADSRCAGTTTQQTSGTECSRCNEPAKEEAARSSPLRNVAKSAA